MEIEWYKYMKEGINNKMKGETNACPKQGDTPVKQGDMQGAVVGYTINLPTAKLFVFVNRLFINNKDFSS